MIKQWLYTKIYGKKDAEITSLKERVFELEERVFDLHEDIEYHRSKRGEAEEIVRRIELDYEDSTKMRDLTAIRMKLVEQNRNNIEVVFAVSPIEQLLESGFGPDEDPEKVVTRQERVQLHCYAGVKIINPHEKEFIDQMTHEMCHDLARSIGEQIKERLLGDAGWRVKR